MHWNGTALAASVLCCTTGVHHVVSQSNLRHLDCFVSSPLGLWDLSLCRHAIVNNLVDELRLVRFSCFRRRLCFFMRGQLHHCDGLFRNRQWHTHIDDLFVDSLCREHCLRTIVFAGVVNVAHRLTRPSLLVYVLSVSSPNPSVDVLPRILTGSPPRHN